MNFFPNIFISSFLLSLFVPYAVSVPPQRAESSYPKSPAIPGTRAPLCAAIGKVLEHKRPPGAGGCKSQSPPHIGVSGDDIVQQPASPDPSVMLVPLKSMGYCSASGASSDTASVPLRTGTDSPVRTASLTRRLLDSIKRLSAGTISADLSCSEALGSLHLQGMESLIRGEAMV